MSDHSHFSRREVLGSIAAVGRGCAMVPLVALGGGAAAQQPKAVLRGSVRDGASGELTSAKVRVTNPVTGEVFWPSSAIRTMPKKPRQGGWSYFYVRGEYEIALPPGRYEIEVVRGICHQAVVKSLEVGAGSSHRLDVTVPVLRDLHPGGWYSGNTHTHYQVEIDENPDDRLRLVPPAEALDVSVISYLLRNDLAYVTNRYPVGRLPQFSRDGTLVNMGEECRNNMVRSSMGYGHVLFLNIPRLLQPVSTGLLARDPKAPDFPTISMLCGEAKRIGGTTIWCHNGRGMELPVAAALGVLDAFNVGDAEQGEYSRYYALLNCGFRMPLSTGTDWWIYDHNRVFTKISGGFSYESWLKGLHEGRSFITNGPLLEFTVDGRGPGDQVEPGKALRVAARAVSRVPFEKLQVVRDGEVIAEQSATGGREAVIEKEIPAGRSGWIAARVAGGATTHGGYTVFAHTGPVYLKVKGAPPRFKQAADRFAQEIEESIVFIRKNYRFSSEADLAVATGHFRRGQEYYQRLAAASD